MSPTVMAGLIFIIILALIYGINLLLTRRQSEVVERLKKYTEEIKEVDIERKPVSREELGIFDTLDKVMEKRTFSQKLQYELSKANLPIRVSEFISFRFVGTTLLALVGYLLAKTGGMVILGVIGYMFPMIYVKSVQKKRQKAFAAQIEDALRLISSSLKSGYSFLQAVEMVSKEMKDPIALEFKKVLRETSLGMSLEESLNKLAARMESDDFDLVVTAVIIQRETGGNLAEILDNIGHTIRERIRIKGEIMTLTAMGRLSGMIVSALPFGLAIILYLMQPSYMEPLFTTLIGKGMIALGIIMMATGIFMIKKIISIEV